MEATAYVDVMVYAVLATLTPLGFAITVAVIESGRVKALAFAVGFVGAQLATCAVLVAVGASAAPVGDREHPTFRALFELGFGLALLLAAAHVRRPSQTTAASTSSRAAAFRDRLRRLRPLTAFVAGTLLGVGGPKRLVLTTLAAAAIATSNSQTSELAALVVAYTTVATLLVWAPIVAFQVAGDRVVATLARLERWLLRHQQGATFYALATVGLVGIADALRMLL